MTPGKDKIRLLCGFGPEAKNAACIGGMNAMAGGFKVILSERSRLRIGSLSRGSPVRLERDRLDFLGQFLAGHPPPSGNGPVEIDPLFLIHDRNQEYPARPRHVKEASQPENGKPLVIAEAVYPVEKKKEKQKNHDKRSHHFFLSANENFTYQ
jgi:hypothetical protein